MRTHQRLAAAALCLLLWQAAPVAAFAAQRPSGPLAQSAEAHTSKGIAGRSRLDPAVAGETSSPSASGSEGEAPVPVALSERPPQGRRLSADDALEIASALPRMKRLMDAHLRAQRSVYLKGPKDWQVSWFSQSGKEIGQVIVVDSTGRAIEAWTGIQVAWTMARGYPGAFGGLASSLYIWLPLCLLFVVPFFDWRRPLRLLHLDLLMLLSLSVSLAFFDHGLIHESVPLAYPPLIYLISRMLLIALGRAQPPQARLMVPKGWLAMGLIPLVCFRIALNVVDGNVIDVGYAGVIGAQRIAAGRPLYGGYPKDNAHGDTYAPFNYEAYAPFEQALGWSGHWDSLPAAHAASIAFDLLSLLLLFLIGRRVRGPSLGVALSWAWATYPFTLLVLESDSNDALVAATVLAALLAVAWRQRAGGRRLLAGALSALAGLTKLAPLALAPILAMDGLRGMAQRRRAGALALFATGFVLAAAVSLLPALSHDSLGTIVQRVVAYQAGRETPFSIWGLYGLPQGTLVVEGLAAAGALALALLPRPEGMAPLAAGCAAILIALQLGLDYWFYLYIVWFFPLTMIALLGRLSPKEPSRLASASGSAGSRPLSAAASS